MKKNKKYIILISILFISIISCFGCTKNMTSNDSENNVSKSTTKNNSNASDNPENYIPITKMILSSTGIKNGIIDPQYGAASKDKLGAMPLESIPLEWGGAPQNTKSYAITIVDYDTIPILGFPWIHWVVADIPVNVNSLPANASTTMSSSIIQGINSYANGYPLDLISLKGFQVEREKAFHYGGMVPVNFPHKYTMKVYALDTTLNLKNGFGLNDLYNSMEGHVLGEGTLYGIYNADITKL